MKQIEINQAYKKLAELSENKELSEMAQWNIYKVRKALRPNAEFYDERKKMLAEEYKDFADENGDLFGEPAKKYVSDLRELEELDVDVPKYEIPTVQLVKGIDCMMIEALEGFINFEPPEE